MEVAGRRGPILNFCANNYLGLSSHPEVSKKELKWMTTDSKIDHEMVDLLLEVVPSISKVSPSKVFYLQLKSVRSFSRWWRLPWRPSGLTVPG